jgi:RimJ/RimL family protein N-acetyltransferase
MNESRQISPAARHASRRYRANIDRVRGWFRTRNGKILGSRLLTPADAPLLVDFFFGLSIESRMRRFHQGNREVSPEEIRTTAERLANVDNLTTGGAVLAVERGIWGERIVAVARLMREDDTPNSPEAEAAIVVRDDYHGQGVGSEILRRLVLLARKMGVRTMVANIEASNHPALRLFRSLDLPTTSETSRAETTLYIQMPE